MTKKKWYIAIGLLLFLGLAYGYRIHKEIQDFAVFYLAGKRVLGLESLYQEADGFEIFKYSPLFAIFMAPFSFFPIFIAKQLWLVLSLCSLVGIFVLLNELTKHRVRPWGPLGLAVLTYLTMFIYLDDNFVYGQVNLIILFLEVLAFKFMYNNQFKSAAVSLSLAIIFKLTPLVFVPYLIVRKQWKTLAFLGLFLVLGLIIPALIYGWSGNLQLLVDWRLSMQSRHPITDPSAFLFNDNLQSLIYSLFGPIPVNYNGFNKNLFNFSQPVANFVFCIVILSIALSFLIFLIKNKTISKNRMYELSILLLLQTILSPLAWKHTYVHLIPLVYLLFIVYQTSEKWLYRLLIPIVIIISIPRDLTPGRGPILEFYWLHLWFAIFICTFLLFQRRHDSDLYVP